MSMFETNGPVDLSDEGLYTAWEAEMADLEQEEVQRDPEHQPDAGDICILETDRSAVPVSDQESRWQDARQAVCRQWPEAEHNMDRLVKRMAEISQRYGNVKLWQEHTAGIMQAAAMELFGPPSGEVSRAVKAAAAAARKAAFREAEMLQKEKRGLDAGGRHKGGFKPISEEEKLIRAMASSRSRGIF